VDSIDTAILEFARRWMPFGGPRPEDVLVEFGMTTARYDEHLARILETLPDGVLPIDELTRLRASPETGATDGYRNHRTHMEMSAAHKKSRRRTNPRESAYSAPPDGPRPTLLKEHP
jgi:hypothetical protein